MRYDARIRFDKLEVGQSVSTGGIFYGPYYALKVLAFSDQRVAIHVKGHHQFWSQIRHYIPASVIVFEKIRKDEHGSRECRKIFDKETGKRSKEVQAEAINLVKEGQ